MSDLLTVTSTSDSAESLIRSSALVQRTFDHHTQNSGNVSWLVDFDGRALFVKSAGAPGAWLGLHEAVLDHSERVSLLHNAVQVARSCHHTALAQLRNVIATSTGPALVYDAAPGELVGAPRAQRADPTSAYQRFAQLTPERMLAIFDVLIDLHFALAEHGWIACDLYDGCLIVAPDDRLTVVDLDGYRRGPFVNTMGRMFGAARFMAPEENTRGAVIDQRTTVTHFGTRLSENLGRFIGPTECADVLRQACRPEPADRFQSVAAFASAWAQGRR